MDLHSLFGATPLSGHFWITCFSRLLLAALCGALIGLERTHRQKGAGIRTHIIVSLGACVMMLVSKYGFYDVLDTGLSADPSRIASNLMTGMGFIGAGVIFVKNTSIKGLTTAAGLWATTGVAMAIGSGLYAVGIFTAAVMLILQIVLHLCLRTVDTAGSNDLTITITNNDGALERVKEQLKEYNVVIESCKFKREGEQETLRIVAKTVGYLSPEQLLTAAKANSDILSMEF